MADDIDNTAPQEGQEPEQPQEPQEPKDLLDVVKDFINNMPATDKDSLEVTEYEGAATHKSEPAADGQPGMTAFVVGQSVLPNAAARPETLDTFIGQPRAVTRLRVAISSARGRGAPMPHTLLEGPPGLGKTTLAKVIANEMNVGFVPASGGTIKNPAALADVLFQVTSNAVVFIDEIHAMGKKAEEALGVAMEDHYLDVPQKGGGVERFIIQPFTLVGATTEAGNLTKPLLDRFGLKVTYYYYSTGEIARILLNYAPKLGLQLEPEAAGFIAGRSRGTPRVAIELTKRVRDVAYMHKTSVVSPPLVQEAMELEGVDDNGLLEVDWQYMETLMTKFRGPAGSAAIAAAMQVNTSTLVEKVEPYLLRMGYVQRTPGGRVLSEQMRGMLLAKKAAAAGQ